MLLRHEVIQSILDRYDRPSYLEIGVNEGATFKQVAAHLKVAVDPKFLFQAEDSDTERFFEIPSDDYFAHHAPADAPFDVIFVDGLHTFEQTLRDVLNAITVLQPRGVIVIDDVLPNSYDASIADFAEVEALRALAVQVGHPWTADGSWMGDVYKLPFFIQSYLQEFSYATVAENHGQTVMWRQRRSVPADKLRTVEAITRLEYRHCLLERAVFEVQPMAEILRRLPTV